MVLTYRLTILNNRFWPRARGWPDVQAKQDVLPIKLQGHHSDFFTAGKRCCDAYATTGRAAHAKFKFEENCGQRQIRTSQSRRIAEKD